MFGGSITKRAQIPFSRWLPMAMAAPTPVSALVHSSTLVTAGVYLLIRFSFYFTGFNALIYLMLFLSSITMFIAGVAAMFEMDAKKMVALSTLRQLGFMIFRVFLMLPELAYYHLLVHALFKALIFMAVGVFIHSYNRQDLRLMGGVFGRLPFCSCVLVCARISICGFPFMSGFFSKDLIIESVIYIRTNLAVVTIMLLGVILTVCYSVRMCYYVILKFRRGRRFLGFRDFRGFYVTPMLVLLLGAIVGGVFLRNLFVDCYLV